MSAWNFHFFFPLSLYCSLVVVGRTVAVFRGWASSACVACDDGFSSCFLLTQRTYTQRKALSGRIIPVKIDRYSHPIYHARHTHLFNSHRVYEWNILELLENIPDDRTCFYISAFCVYSIQRPLPVVCWPFCVCQVFPSNRSSRRWCILFPMGKEGKRMLYFV